MTLEEYINKSGLTYIAFAKEVGISRTSLYNYIKGRRPRPDVREKIKSFTKGKVVYREGWQ